MQSLYRHIYTSHPPLFKKNNKTQQQHPQNTSTPSPQLPSTLPSPSPLLNGLKLTMGDLAGQPPPPTGGGTDQGGVGGSDQNAAPLPPHAIPPVAIPLPGLPPPGPGQSVADVAAAWQQQQQQPAPPPAAAAAAAAVASKAAPPISVSKQPASASQCPIDVLPHEHVPYFIPEMSTAQQSAVDTASDSTTGDKKKREGKGV